MEQKQGQEAPVNKQVSGPQLASSSSAQSIFPRSTDLLHTNSLAPNPTLQSQDPSFNLQHASSLYQPVSPRRAGGQVLNPEQLATSNTYQQRSASPKGGARNQPQADVSKRFSQQTTGPNNQNPYPLQQGAGYLDPNNMRAIPPTQMVQHHGHANNPPPTNMARQSSLLSAPGGSSQLAQYSAQSPIGRTYQRYGPAQQQQRNVGPAQLQDNQNLHDRGSTNASDRFSSDRSSQGSGTNMRGGVQNYPQAQHYGGRQGGHQIVQNRGQASASETTPSSFPHQQMNPQQEFAMSDPPKLQNIVSTAYLGTRIDLRTVAQRVGNAEYNPKRFAAAIIRIRNPKSTALVFTSGKMVITGARSEEESEQAAKSYSKMIRKNLDNNKSVVMKEFKIQNIVASVSAGFGINLEKMLWYIQEHNKQTRMMDQKKNICDYNPETFPGLIFRMFEPKVVLLIFTSGKIVLTGAKTRDEINKAYEGIHGVLRMHRKKDTVQVESNTEQRRSANYGGHRQ